ncbi:MAG TPA: DoxX family protein [Terriglobales bacterium]|nr:DoxX family protein [Terriglobales bacterium]
MSKQCGPTVLRVVVGIVFLMHGQQKLFGFGIHGTIGFFTHAGIPLPAVSAVVVTFVEFLGGIALILGLGTRWAAALLAIDMLGAIGFVHFKNGFFLMPPKMGYEYALTLLAACIALAMMGPGSAALDRFFGKA